MKAIRASLGVFFCLSVPVRAQSEMTSGIIEGVVRDATREALPGVTVTLTHLGIGISRSYRTSLEGRFTGVLLPVGNYALN
jgi:hypothetical protein